MPHLKPAPGALRDLNYTPRFYCQLCGSGVPAVSISERRAGGGVVRELACPVCHCRERVGIRLAEDFSGWVFFQAEAAGHESGPDDPAERAPDCAGPAERNH
jgi:hypothetical protein